MAKVKGSDAIETGFFDDAIKGGDALEKSLLSVESALRKIAKAQGAVVKDTPLTSFKNINKQTKAINDVRSATDKLNKIEIQRIKVSQENSKAQQQANKVIQENIKIEKEQERVKQAKIRTSQLEARETERLAKIQRKQSIEIEKSTNAYKILTARTNRAQAEFKRLSAEFGLTSRRAKTARREFERLDNELRKINDGARDGRRDVGRYSKALDGVKKSVRALGLAGAGLLIFRNVFRTVRDFEQAQADLSAISGETTDQLAKLDKQAKDLGATTQFSATQIVSLQIELAKLGFTVEQITLSTEAISNFAAATGAELSDAARLGGSALRAFNLDASEMERVVSTLGVATTKSALNFEFLDTALSTVAPVASSFGFTIEETTALLGQLANAGFDASSAATATRNILLNLADANGKLAQELGKPVTSLEELVSGLKELEDNNIDLAKAMDLTDKRSVAAFSTFLKGADSLIPLRDNITDVSDELQIMADKRLDTVGGSIKLLQSAWEGLVLDLNEGTGVFASLKDVILFTANNLTTIVKVIGTAVITWASYRAALLLVNKETNTFKKLGLVSFLGKITRGVRLMATGTKGAARGFKNIGSAIKSIPLAGLISGLVAAGSLLLQFIGRAEKTQDALTKIGIEAKKSAAAQTVALETLVRVAKDKTQSDEDRIDAIERINALSPEFLGNITLETINTEAATKALKEYIATLNDRAEATAIMTRLAELHTKSLSIEAEVLREGFQIGTQDLVDQIRKRRRPILDEIAVLKERQELLIRTGRASIGDAAGTGGAAAAENELGLITEINKKIKDERKKLNEALTVSDIRASQRRIEQLEEERKKLLGVKEDNNKKTEEELTLLARLKAELKEINKEREVELDFTGGLKNDVFEDLTEKAQELTDKIIKLEEALSLARKTIEEPLDFGDTDEIGDSIDDTQELADEWIEIEEGLNKELKFLAELRAKDQEEAFAKLANNAENALSILNLIVQQKTEQRIDFLDKEIQASQEGQNLLRQIALQGVSDVNENLAFEQQKQAELEQRKEQEIKRAAQFELILSAVSTFNSEIQNGATAGEALGSTAVAMIALEALVSGLDLFYEGTENTGTVANPLDSNGGRLAIHHDNERIMTAAQNKVIGPMTNWELANLAAENRDGKIGMQQAIQVHAFADSTAILNKFDELKVAIESKPVMTNINYNEFEKAMVVMIDEKNKITRNHYKTKGGVF